MAVYTLDSDTISYILRRRQTTLDKLRAAIQSNDTILISPVAYYEVRRGLLYKNAPAQLQELERMVDASGWRDIARGAWEDAAARWADGQRVGTPFDDDADLLIAAFALSHGATVVTNNTKHFARLGVQLANWA